MTALIKTATRWKASIASCDSITLDAKRLASGKNDNSELYSYSRSLEKTFKGWCDFSRVFGSPGYSLALDLARHARSRNGDKTFVWHIDLWLLSGPGTA
ncbi:hypothetical protein ElyMa_007054800 [Elysia marginata]|uniref:Uncharacterized protein n=1 Tax=Elysia marginata TaxID=1093978 RepID=A0AAV4JVU4_9GAST|nr:hypothetical protein ElyMa_007054800 [Elysia marginata]